MTTTLKRFRDIDLPEFNPFDQVGTRMALAPRARMSDGRVFDRKGDTQAEQGADSLLFVANYYHEDPYLTEARFNNLKAEEGKTGWLYRQRTATKTYERIWARLDRVSAPHNPLFPGLIRDIQLDFFLIDPTWNGFRRGDYEPAWGYMRAVSDSSNPSMPIGAAVTKSVTSGSSTTVTLVNGGNAIVKGVRVHAYANGGATLTGGFYLSYDASAKDGSPYYHLTHTEDVGASLSQQTVFDTLAKFATDNGISPSGKIDNFDYGGSHNSDYWLGLHPGSNTITIGTNSGTFPAGGVNFVFEYCEAWQ